MRGSPTSLVLTFPGVHEVILNLNHFPGPTTTQRRFLENHLNLNKSQTTTRGIWFREPWDKLVSNWIPNVNVHDLSVNRIWTRPRVLLVTGPNGKCHQTAEIKNWPPHDSLFSGRFLWGLAITQDVANLLSVALESPRGGSLESKSQLLLPMKKV